MNTDELVVIEGCLIKGVEAGCTMLQTKTEPPKLYSLHGVSIPPLNKGLGVQIHGRLRGVSHCLQGEPLEVESWNWTRERCHI